MSGCGWKRIGAFAENGKVAAIAELAAPPAPSDLLDDSKPFEIGERRVDRRRAQASPLYKQIGREEGVLLKQFVDPQC